MAPGYGVAPTPKPGAIPALPGNFGNYGANRGYAGSASPIRADTGFMLSSLARDGAQAGLDFLGYTTQSAFLGHLGLGQWLERGRAARPQPAELAGMRALAKPGGLGDFKVMAQGKNAGRPRLWGFHPAAAAATLAELTPPPTLTPQHLNLPAGRYPAAETEFEAARDALWPPDTA